MRCLGLLSLDGSRLRSVAVVAGLVLGGSAALADATTPIAEDGILLAQKKKKKRKKKKVTDDGFSVDDFGPTGVSAVEDNDTGVGVHRNQEGVDTPYKAEITGLTDISLMQTSIEGSEDGAKSLTSYSAEGHWLFIVGPFEIGPDIAYRSVTSASPSTETTFDEAGNPTGSTVKTIEVNQTTYVVGGLFKWNFLGDIDQDDLVFFGYGGVGYRASETTVGDADPTKSTGTLIKAGGGVNIFIDSNVAFNPRAEYRIETDTPETEGDEEAPVTTTSGLKILIGLGVFI
jgi:hypothetical protein